MLYIALFFTVFWVAAALYLLINSSRIKYLNNVAVAKPAPNVPLAVIIAVRNEERDLPQALESMCNLQYSQYRLVVINDRSTDRTADILARFKKQYAHLTVIHIQELPAGWLGKNHALYKGYENTEEEWMLFTDADIRYAPETLNKAMQYCLDHQLDHLTVLPDVKSRSAFFNSIMDTFKIMLTVKLRPWAARNPKTKAYFGVGAFNLVKRSAYEIAGTHKRIALRPDDDLKLGECIKFSGLRQDVVYGDQLLSLEWYTSVKEFINGLMKNTFSTVNYNFPKVVFFCMATLFCFVIPLPLLFIAGGATERYLALVMLLFQILLFVFTRGMRGIWWYALMMPVAGSIMVYIMWVSAVRTLLQGGIYWRDSFYSLTELKKNVRY
ncbi:MAG TPA: glycosyltransferase family 2 protein [Flavisolibacter sp.]|nr:glycosyltransferase family 2 protein [Flavisolibacter sp.]